MNKNKNQIYEYEKSISYRNYDLLFDEMQSSKIDKLFNKAIRLKQKGKSIRANAIVLRLQFMEKVKEFYLQEEMLRGIIDNLTSEQTEEKYEDAIKTCKNLNIVDEVTGNNGVTSIKGVFGEIKFSKANDFFPQLEIDSDINDIQKRKGNCHGKSIEYSKKLKKIGIENCIVTANRRGRTDKSEHLHSWNEFSINGKEYVFDYTCNLVMNKEGYYAFNGIKEVFSKISCNDIRNDAKIIEQFNKKLPLKLYLTFRDELMKDLQKNKEIFNEER